MTDPVDPSKLLLDLEIKVPNAYPLEPARQAIVDEALKRPPEGATGPLFVSWVSQRPECAGARFSATIIGGMAMAEKFVAAVQRYEMPSIVRIGRRAYEGLPAKTAPTSGWVQPTREELRAILRNPTPTASDFKVLEGLDPERPLG